MLLIDTSAWIEHLRLVDSPISLTVARAIRQRQAATTDQVLMELLAGTTDPAKLVQWQGMLNACEFVQQRTYVDAPAAAQVYRTCRRAGETPRNVSDCLVAAIAMRVGAAVLHRDRDYDVIARHTGLEVLKA